MEPVSTVVTACVSVWPFQVRVTGATPAGVLAVPLSNKTTANKFAPAVTVNGMLMLVDARVFVLPTGASCRTIAVGPDEITVRVTGTLATEPKLFDTTTV